MAKVDIVIPCYNYGRFLEQCVRSVLDQSVSDTRILIIDDRSSDDSLSIATKLAESDHRISVVAHANNKGHIRTYNEGIDWAESEYFLLLSADDLLVPGAFERAIEVMDENPDVGLTYGEGIVWHDDLPLPEIASEQKNYEWAPQDIIGEMCRSTLNFVSSPTAIARTACQKKVGGYRESLPHSGDMEMWLRFAAHGGVARINAVQAIYRKHTNAMSKAYFDDAPSDFSQCYAAFESFFEGCGSGLPNARALREQARHKLARRAFQRGVGLLRRGRFDTGLRLLRESMCIDPNLRYAPPIWQIFKFPGTAGRAWAWSSIRRAAAGGHLGRMEEKPYFKQGDGYSGGKRNSSHER